MRKQVIRHPLWVRWIRMRERCFNPKCPAYPNYGGRGITVCDRWLSFKCFVEDMMDGFSSELTLDRIDNNGSYSKENCRWATREVQNNNTRQNNYIEFNGQSKTLPQWARELGIKRSTLAQRLHVYKWSIEKTLLTN